MADLVLLHRGWADTIPPPAGPRFHSLTQCTLFFLSISAGGDSSRWRWLLGCRYWLLAKRHPSLLSAYACSGAAVTNAAGWVGSS